MIRKEREFTCFSIEINLANKQVQSRYFCITFDLTESYYHADTFEFDSYRKKILEIVGLRTRDKTIKTIWVSFSENTF